MAIRFIVFAWFLPMCVVWVGSAHSACLPFLPVDLNKDCTVNLTDFAQLASQWFSTNETSTASSWDYAADFSTGYGNPNSQWAYGYFDNAPGGAIGGGMYILYTSTGSGSPIINWMVPGSPDTHG
ncbi:MAG: hypothetical protein Q7T18_04215, partial [Sedimentisphaerales bacterium]|nr:hypothetical protein [Sedimentisphaerales bacterium]